MWILIYLFITHTVADFYLQSRDVAVNKGKDIKYLIRHVVEYTMVTFVSLFILSLILAYNGIGAFGLLNVGIYLLFTFLFHMLTDLITSRISSHFYKQGKMNFFWYTIGTDQLLHIIQITLCYHFFL